MEKLVRVGVGVIVIDSKNRILIGKRKGNHGDGKYGLPGGHQEFGEKIQETAIRELREETNLITETVNITLDFFTDDFMTIDQKHYITFFPIVKKYDGILLNMEPNKCEKWYWLSWEEIKELGEKLFIPLLNFIEKYPDFDPKKYK